MKQPCNVMKEGGSFTYDFGANAYKVSLIEAASYIKKMQSKPHT